MSILSKHELKACVMALIFCNSGLGLMEYLNWCEDLGMEAIMAVWAGMQYTVQFTP